MSSALAFSPATIAASSPPTMLILKSPLSLSAASKCRCYAISSTRRASTMMTVRCDVAVKSTASVESSSSSEADTELKAEEEKAKASVGRKVRVTADLKVYHVVKLPELELKGMEGVVKDYVAVWKGKRISANLPYKVQFLKEIEGRGAVKFFSHLKEDEFEFVD